MLSGAEEGTKPEIDRAATLRVSQLALGVVVIDRTASFKFHRKGTTSIKTWSNWLTERKFMLANMSTMKKTR